MHVKEDGSKLDCTCACVLSALLPTLYTARMSEEVFI